MSYGQTSAPTDTVPVRLDHLHLEDVLVLDEWINDHKPRNQDHQLEMQLKQLKGINLISAMDGPFAGAGNAQFLCDLWNFDEKN